MGNINSTTSIKLITTNKTKLLQNNFYRIAENEFLYKFPVHKYNGKTLIRCDMYANTEDKLFSYDVIEPMTKSYYSHFYCDENIENNLVLQKVKKKIGEELQKLEEQKIIKIEKQKVG